MELVELWDLAAGTLIAGWPAETNADPRGELLARRAAGRYRQARRETSRIWDVATRAEMAAFRPAAASRSRALAYSPDGRRLAGRVVSQAPVVLWDVANRPESAVPWMLRRGTAGSSSRRMDALLAAADMDGDVESVGPASREAASAELKGHVMGVLRAAFFPDGKTLVTGGMDGRVKLWNLATYQEILTLVRSLGDVLARSASPRMGARLAVGYMGLARPPRSALSRAVPRGDCGGGAGSRAARASGEPDALGGGAAEHHNSPVTLHRESFGKELKAVRTTQTADQAHRNTGMAEPAPVKTTAMNRIGLLSGVDPLPRRTGTQAQPALEAPFTPDHQRPAGQ